MMPLNCPLQSAGLGGTLGAKVGVDPPTRAHWPGRASVSGADYRQSSSSSKAAGAANLCPPCTEKITGFSDPKNCTPTRANSRVPPASGLALTAAEATRERFKAKVGHDYAPFGPFFRAHCAAPLFSRSNGVLRTDGQG